MNMSAKVLLENLNRHKHISIRKTVEENISIVSSLLSTHVLSDCDVIPKMFGIGKGKSSSVKVSAHLLKEHKC